MLTKTFADDDEDNSNGEMEDSKAAPEYRFEGYNVEFSKKISLTPLSMHRRKEEKGKVSG